MSRSCDAIGCTAETASGRFMCIRHWRMVPLETQQAINTRYRVGWRNFAFLSDPVYLKACISAIDGIAIAERMPTGDNSYSRLLRGVERRAEGSV